MEFRELAVPGAWVITSRQFGDERGMFLESFKASEFEKATGRALDLRQVNCSVSAAGVLRGIHYTEDPPGQAKYVTCVRGAFLDVVVDLRPGSPTYGRWDSVLLDDVDRRSMFLSEGLGHAILSLEDHSTVTYLCSLEYTPEFDREIDAFDARLGIDWPTIGRDGNPLTFVRSAKDAAAPPFS
ncbi:dTDP-4-dehydrorhamnose 3,5-epimerase family protein [Nocardia brasiliensis]|uniref:dTDP-6-deoxy-4-ketoglucose epimerase n=1 Tax=Nocardia brasiliensis (strain ATCC 700358 / HUJEG-1) TaxID=1133849 RepID=K0EFZ2_NOCB7|nr:dTDP-4-dehydrorhamnose 3,5-epimerase [Nocardia brasiliensis]AFT98132.1 dTDP-6-deoxy-4-ketoglucose epimerase [Nocardia brasiliensis ATCC 700358]OCF90811.1 dTDP-4-dehydrorhamnose 3,5-epimerase [Nocardia brasiliensis]